MQVSKLNIFLVVQTLQENCIELLITIFTNLQAIVCLVGSVLDCFIDRQPFKFDIQNSSWICFEKMIEFCDGVLFFICKHFSLCSIFNYDLPIG